MFRKIKLRQFLKAMWILILSFLFLMLHVAQWLLCGVTFVSFILPLSLYLVAGIPLAWWLARKCRNWLNRALEEESDTLNVIVMLFMVSWIPPALLLSTNYLLAGKAVLNEVLPVVKRGESYSRNTTYYWVKVEKHNVRKRIIVDQELPARLIDSVAMDVKKGYLGFEFFEHPRFILHPKK
ncbi:hypothetical protein ACTJJB_03495 [Chitinophaga sp. 22536]|uniref:hypothetical protein n=1 Tax=unclassified Chitinophaga TaxID=2619133 RepID=UPI003F83F315